jgi:succinate-semialdehyde dehydrogenase/glutarate-semialdehyde dehydrogenase
MSLKSINPFTNEVMKEFIEMTDNEVEKLIQHSAVAFGIWKRTGFDYRRSLITKVAGLLKNNVRKYAGSITAEMGKPIKEADAEIEKCVWVCEYYAENAEKFLSPEIVKTDADKSYVSYEPLGTILGIMPWNFPYWQAFRFVIPTIMAGNTVLLKHASNVQICARNIESIFEQAGFPENVFLNLGISSSGMEKIIRHEKVMAVSLTGSEAAGQKVAAAAGESLKKCVLELGGSNAFVVLEDADLKKAVEVGIKARFQNTGQSCIAAKRFIVEKKISEKFISKLSEAIRKLKSGDPLKEDTEVGPVSSVQQAELVEDQVRRSVEMGARIIVEGKRDKAFYPPSLVTDVNPGMPLFDEEVFGPVAPVTIAANTEEAVKLANTTKFGLGVSLFTKDIAKAEYLAPEFHDGSVFINGLVKSDPRLPFGGTRRSGYGRELHSLGIREFVNAKTVWIKNH